MAKLLLPLERPTRRNLTPLVGRPKSLYASDLLGISRRHRSLGAAALALAAFAPLAALAAPPAPPGSAAPSASASAAATASPENQAAAQQHFQKAKELYQQGSYRDALTELEQARALDPQAKDLVFNLGVVSEKLGRIDDALSWFRTYVEMEGVTPQERARAESNVRRLEGARREMPTASASASAPAPSATTPKTPPKDDPPKGRVDALTIAAGGLAIAGFGVGGTFGALSLSTRPDAGFVTGRDGTYADLKDKADRAHTQAIVADIGLAVGVVATLATVYLYFSRPRAQTVGTATGGPR